MPRPPRHSVVNIRDPLDARPAPCNPLNVPAGTDSPAIDDGFYVLLKPLSVGTHTLHYHAKNPGASFTEDLTYRDSP